MSQANAQQEKARPPRPGGRLSGLRGPICSDAWYLQRLQRSTDLAIKPFWGRVERKRGRMVDPLSWDQRLDPSAHARPLDLSSVRRLPSQTHHIIYFSQHELQKDDNPLP
jgi:hypothetical protein